MTARVATILLNAPESVPDQHVADALYRILRGEMRPTDPARLYPDPDSLEVHVSRIDDKTDAWMRREVFGPGLTSSAP